MKRIVLGFALAPLTSGFLQGIVMGNFGAVVFALVFAYPFSLILGVPAFLLFRKYGWLKLWQIAAAGAILGVMSGLMFSLPVGFENYSVQSILGGLGLFGLHGLVVSLAFWLLALTKMSSKNV